MPKGRPGGNPDLVRYQYATDREEPCTAKMTLRLPPSQYAKLQEIDNWQEKTRRAIAQLLEVELEQRQLDGTATEDARAAEPARTARNGSKAPTSGTGEGSKERQTGDTQTKGKGKRSPRARAAT